MITISSHKVDHVKDPFGILSGKRYEFRLDLDVEEDDELYSPMGIYARAVLKIDEGKATLLSSDLLERSTDRLLDFDMEEDEEQAVLDYCQRHLPEA